MGALDVVIQVAAFLAAVNRSEGFALTGYDIPGCVEDGAWMLRENSSVVAAVVVAVAHPGLEKLLEFHYGIGPSGVRGSIRFVFRVPKVILKIFPQTACCRGSGGVAKRGLDPCRERAAREHFLL